MHLCPVQIFSKMSHKKIVTSEFVLAETHSDQLAITVLLKHCANVIVLHKNGHSSLSRHLLRFYLSIPLEMRMTMWLILANRIWAYVSSVTSMWKLSESLSNFPPPFPHVFMKAGIKMEWKWSLISLGLWWIMKHWQHSMSEKLWFH